MHFLTELLNGAASECGLVRYYCYDSTVITVKWFQFIFGTCISGISIDTAEKIFAPTKVSDGIFKPGRVASTVVVFSIKTTRTHSRIYANLNKLDQTRQSIITQPTIRLETKSCRIS